MHTNEWFQTADVTVEHGNTVYRNNGSVMVVIPTLYDAVDTIINLPDKVGGYFRSSLLGTYGFTLTNTFAEAAKLIENGWTEHLDQVIDMSDKVVSDERILAMIDNAKFKQIYSINGALPSVPMFCAGSQTPMITYIPTVGNKSARVARILVGNGMLQKVPAKSYLERGLIVCALIKVLHLMGWQVDLYAEATIRCTTNIYKNHSILHHVQKAGQVFDAEAVLFQLAHPSMHRRINFGIRESGNQTELKNFGPGGSYGSTINPLCANFVDAHVTIDAIQPGQSIKDPIQWIMNHVHTITGEM